MQDSNNMERSKARHFDTCHSPMRPSVTPDKAKGNPIGRQDSLAGPAAAIFRGGCGNASFLHFAATKYPNCGLLRTMDDASWSGGAT